MTQSPQIAPDELERQLAAMTVWTSGEDGTERWRFALEQVRHTRPAALLNDRLSRLGNWRVPTRVLAAAALVLLVGVVSVAVLVPSLGKARRSALAEHATAPLSAFSQGPARQSRFAEGSRFDAERLDQVKELAGGVAVVTQPATPAESQAQRAVVASSTVVDRQVIRKATIDIQTPDVPAAFMKATLVISEASGEYIENSALTGEGAAAAGSLTLRVAATRLSEVLNRLRPLGHVASETSSGEDVTDRVVDLEARLRNEQRVETELLELLAKRQDAPLKEILELRETISRVRQQIEQLVAQRDRLGRLVSLATVLVTLRSDDAPVAMRGKGIGGYFADRIGDAWRGSLRFLADSVSLIVSVVVGGSIWWLALAAAILAAVAVRRRAVAQAAIEPAPVE